MSLPSRWAEEAPAPRDSTHRAAPHGTHASKPHRSPHRPAKPHRSPIGSKWDTETPPSSAGSEGPMTPAAKSFAARLGLGTHTRDDTEDTPTADTLDAHRIDPSSESDEELPEMGEAGKSLAARLGMLTVDSPGKPHKEKPERRERPEKHKRERRQRSERSERPERLERPERRERPERPEKHRQSHKSDVPKQDNSGPHKLDHPGKYVTPKQKRAEQELAEKKQRLAEENRRLEEEKEKARLKIQQMVDEMENSNWADLE